MNRIHYQKVNNNPSNLRLLVHKVRHKFGSVLDSWQVLHNKSLQTAGRGGKGHLGASASHGWNRKGRW